MKHLNGFDLADDLALLSQRRYDMQSKLNDLAVRSSTAGLIVNVSKIKSVDISTGNPSNFTVAEQALEKVESLHYLGSQVALDGGTKSDIGVRTNKARAALRAYEIQRTKIRIFNSNVKSELLYASEM